MKIKIRITSRMLPSLARHVLRAKGGRERVGSAAWPASSANRLADGAAPHAVANSNGLPNGLGLIFARKRKRVIFLCMAKGGPSHLETFDYKARTGSTLMVQPMPESFTQRPSRSRSCQGKSLGRCKGHFNEVQTTWKKWPDGERTTCLDGQDVCRPDHGD